MSTTSSSSTNRTPTKRILTELSAFSSTPASSHPGIEALAPISPSNLLSLQAILNTTPLSLPPTTTFPHTSPPPPSTNTIIIPKSLGYTPGRWLLSITIPPTYPVAPPTIKFVTKICHANVKWETGEICLDVLKENWSPVLGVVGALECVLRLMGEPGVDSPLNLEVAALLREGDTVGARGLVGWWTGEERFVGVFREEEGVEMGR